MAYPNQGSDLERLIREFETIRHDMLHMVDEWADLLEDIHPALQPSAQNLLHYLALRSRDLRPLQARLSYQGLSSLGRAESYVLFAVESVLAILRRLAGDAAQDTDMNRAVLDLEAGQRLLSGHTEAVLGVCPESRGVSIMVTMPSQAAEDYTLVSDLVRAGMDCMRINCAHNTPAEWARMIEYLGRARTRHQRPCRILMDLAGPKVRTGPLEPGPSAIKFRPKRSAYGEVEEPARIWLSTEERLQSPPTPADASFPVPEAWLRRLEVGDRIRFQDTRGASRRLEVVAVDELGCWAESNKTAYVDSGTVLRLDRKEDEDDRSLDAEVGPLPTREVPLTLRIGDELVVTHSNLLGRNAVHDAIGHVLLPARIGCTADQVFEDIRTGDTIWFDDGKIGGIVERREKDQFHVRITRTRAQGAKLASEKGINLPDTHLRLPALTDKDREDLRLICPAADMVALSFVNSAEDVRELRELLEPLGDEQPAIVLKIETRRGFENLPEMMLEAMRSPRCAVMIARGDLAVECGFERLAEVQEEILWLCEAAHVPVIWATQVLESLAKQGMPSRAEVTDAAMAHRAECVMLNKGEYIVQAVRVLDDILRRMHGHQLKKRSMLRELQLVSSFRRTKKPRALSSQERDRGASVPREIQQG